jgi:hypothetical protein
MIAEWCKIRMYVYKVHKYFASVEVHQALTAGVCYNKLSSAAVHTHSFDIIQWII